MNATTVLLLFCLCFASYAQVLRNPNGTAFCGDYCSIAPNGDLLLPIRGTCFFTNNTNTKDLLSCFCFPPYGGPNCSYVVQQPINGSFFNVDCFGAKTASDNFTFCSCQLGYKGPMCNETCNDVCSGHGACAYYPNATRIRCICDFVRGWFGIYCQYNTDVPVIIFYYVLDILVHGVVYIGLWIYSLTMIYAQFRHNQCKSFTLTHATTINISIGLFFKVLGYILNAASAGAYEKFEQFYNPSLFAAYNIFRILGTICLIVSNIMVIFKWYQICVAASTLQVQTASSKLQVFLFFGINITVYIVFFIFAVLQGVNVVRVDIVAILAAVAAILIPIGFLITGLYMYYTLKIVDPKVKASSLKFMQFMILLYVTTILVVVLLITKTIMLTYNNPLGFGPDGGPYVVFFVFLTIIIWLGFLLELICFVLLVYLLTDKNNMLQYVCCCLANACAPKNAN